jgi:hypothetical protein
VLAVVEDEHGVAVDEVGDDGVLDRSPARVDHTQRVAHGGGDEGVVGDRHQVDEPDLVAAVCGQGAGHRGGEPRLAHPTRPHGRDEPVRLDRGGELGDLGGPPDEGRERHR